MLGGTLSIDAALTILARNYIPDPRVYVGRKIAPIIGVPERKAQYPVYSRDAFRAAESSNIDRAGHANLITKELSTDLYHCKGHGLGDKITRIGSYEVQWMSPTQQRTDSVMTITNQLVVEHEKTVASIVVDTTNYAAAHILDVNTASIAWDAATGDPIADITNMAMEVVKQTGRFPNVLWFDPNAWLAILKNANFRAKYLPTFNGAITETIFADLLPFNVQVVVCMAPELTSAAGMTETMAFTWASSSTERCGLLYVAPGPSLYNPSALYTFGWNLPGSLEGFITGSWFENGTGGVYGADVLETDWFYDVRATGTYGGLLIAGVILYDLLT